MPALDRTGPWRGGPMTGRGLGLCHPAWRGHYRPWCRGWHSRAWGYGPGWFWWTRRAWGPAWAGPYGPYSMTPKEEAEMLKAEAEDLRSALEEIRKRLEEIEGEKGVSTN